MIAGLYVESQLPLRQVMIIFLGYVIPGQSNVAFLLESPARILNPVSFPSTYFNYLNVEL